MQKKAAGGSRGRDGRVGGRVGVKLLKFSFFVFNYIINNLKYLILVLRDGGTFYLEFKKITFLPVRPLFKITKKLNYSFKYELIFV